MSYEARIRIVAATAVAAGALISLAGCGGTSPTAASSPSPTTPSASAGTGSLTVPACDDLIPPQRIGNVSGVADLAPAPDAPDEGLVIDESLPPSARVALDAAAQTEVCGWGKPDGGAVTSVLIAELPTDVRDKLISDLDSAGFTRSSTDDTITFTRTGAAGTSGRTHWLAFHGNAWVVGVGDDPNSKIPVAVMKALVEANPSLKG